MQLLLDLVLQHVPGPEVQPDAPLQMLVTTIDWSQYVGRIAIGRIERQFVLDALRRNDWNVSRAARETGILRPNFHALMRKYGVRAEDDTSV